MNRGRVRVGTRGSKLALIQAESLTRELEKSDPGLTCELVIIKTRGDRILDSPLSNIAGKGLFITEIEEALLSGEIDLAVHSLKDLPTDLPEDLELGAVLKREDARDALVSRSGKTLDEITPEETIATSSLRRKAQLLHCHSDYRIVDIRGNIDTRLKKLENGACDALVLAASGLKRAGYAHRITEYLDPDLVVPAACQGVIGIEVRRNNEEVENMMKAINHEATMRAARAERAFLGILEGGCQVPIGCFSGVSGGRFEMTGLISDLDGRRVVKKKASGNLNNAVQIARDLAEQILSEGGSEILEEIRASNG